MGLFFFFACMPLFHYIYFRVNPLFSHFSQLIIRIMDARVVLRLIFHYIYNYRHEVQQSTTLYISKTRCYCFRSFSLQKFYKYYSLLVGCPYNSILDNFLALRLCADCSCHAKALFLHWDLSVKAGRFYKLPRSQCVHSSVIWKVLFKNLTET